MPNEYGRPSLRRANTSSVITSVTIPANPAHCWGYRGKKFVCMNFSPSWICGKAEKLQCHSSPSPHNHLQRNACKTSGRSSMVGRECCNPARIFTWTYSMDNVPGRITWTSFFTIYLRKNRILLASAKYLGPEVKWEQFQPAPGVHRTTW